MTVADGDMVRADMIGDVLGVDEVVQSYQFRLMSGGNLTDLAAMEDLVELLEALWVIISQLHAIATVFRRLKGQDVVTKRILPEQTFSPVLAGVVAGDTMPQQVTIPLSFGTVVPRVILRKMFGPSATGNFNVSGEISGAAFAILGSTSAFLLADYTATNGVWQYGYNSPKALAWVEPNVGIFSGAPGSLRRRRLGEGS